MENSTSPKTRFLETPQAFALVVLIGNAIAWAIPSNVIKLIAREQPVVLGRYSRAHFSWLVFALVISAIAVFLRWAPSASARKRRVFMLIAGCLGLVPAFFVVDLALRMRTEYPYAPGEHVYRRPSEARYTLPFEDLPECKRSYPNTPEGYGRVECELTFDKQGYRNLSNPETCQIVTLGDSFTEGSRVSDDQTWPAVLAKDSDLEVYNLGISGYGAPEYLASLKHFVLSKKPKLVICMLYEGNDFRSDRLDARHGISVAQVIATSPIIVGLNDFIANVLGAVGAKRRLSGMEVLDWLPMKVPDHSNGNHYAFPAKQLTELYITREKLEDEGAWYVITQKLKAMKKECEAIGATLAVGYAPNKAHVILPLVADRLDPDLVRRYMIYKKRKLKGPEGDAFLPHLLAMIENQEAHVREWCERREVPFISLTHAMREAVLAGEQVYFTYDQHWSPAGHAAAARQVHASLRQQPRLAALFSDKPATTPTAIVGEPASGS